MYSDIIIGFDGSAPGRDALALGRRLALVTGASATVVCVHPYQAHTADVTADAAVELSWRRGAERILDEARRTMDDVPDVSFRTKAETSPARALRDAALEVAAGVIVVGSTRRQGLARRLGTTAERIASATPCAIAVAPAGYAGSAPRSAAGVVGAAVDGGRETERVARTAGRIARDANARLRLLIAVESDESEGARFASDPRSPRRIAVRRAADRALERAANAAGPDVDVQRRVVEGAPATMLVAESAGLDLLVVGSRGRGGVTGTVIGSVSRACLHHAPCPVAVVHDAGPTERSRIVVGVDGSPGAGAALEWAYAEARLRAVGVYAVCAYDEPWGIASLGMSSAAAVAELRTALAVGAERALEAAEAAAPEGVGVTGEAIRGAAGPALVSASDGSALLVVGSRGRGGFTSLLLGSVSQYCAANARGVVLVVRGA